MFLREGYKVRESLDFQIPFCFGSFHSFRSTLFPPICSASLGAFFLFFIILSFLFVIFLALIISFILQS